MRIRSVHSSLTASAIALLVVLGSSPAAAQEAGSTAGAKPSVAATYNEAQADRGEQVFATVCSFCHQTADFSDATFQTTWKGFSVGEFFTLISMTMPQDNPGRLTPQQYVDVLAYILELNGHPAGKDELPADAKLLEPFVFEFK
jgi:mono/diheme cytochrome c family protein